MSDLIERLRERADDVEFATSLETEAANKLEALQAKIAELTTALAATAEAAATHLKNKIAADAAQQSEIARLREAISNIKVEVDRPTGRFNHLKRVVALNCKVLEKKS